MDKINYFKENIKEILQSYKTEFQDDGYDTLIQSLSDENIDDATKKIIDVFLNFENKRREFYINEFNKTCKEMNKLMIEQDDENL